MKNLKHNNLDLISSKDILGEENKNNLLLKSASGLLMSALGINKVNALNRKLEDKSGVEFIDSLINDLGIKYVLCGEDLKNLPKKGAFIIIANHPYGAVEGPILLKEVLKCRSDFKILGNFLLHRINQLKEYILPVNPFETSNSRNENIAGLKLAIKHLNNGSPLLIFPAGEVSSFNGDSKEITDRKWMKSAVKFIKKAKVPVIPVYFHGSNSMLFHSLGLIHPLFRTAKIPSELFNKRNQVIHIQVGETISIHEQKKYDDTSRFGRFLRAKTYLLGSSLEVKKFFRPVFFVPNPETIVEPIKKEVLEKEISNLSAENLILKQQNFSVFCASSIEIPNVVKEIGRLREITFREIGEGTNKKSDLDEYDIYYQHLFIWDNNTNSIAGAYRIGRGREIMAQYGLKGFYITSLFKVKKEFGKVLSESLELGRSFITKEYQRNPLSLFLLWKGILYYLVKNQEYRYLIGPVSISNQYSKTFRRLIVKYIEENHYNGYLAKYIKPRKKFSFANDNDNDSEVLTENITSLKDFDNTLRSLSPERLRLPVLLKKYLELNGKIVGFNIDPKFNDALDGLLILDLFNVNEDAIRMLAKEINNNELIKRFQLKDPFFTEQVVFESIVQL